MARPRRWIVAGVAAAVVVVGATVAIAAGGGDPAAVVDVRDVRDASTPTGSVFHGSTTTTSSSTTATSGPSPYGSVETDPPPAPPPPWSAEPTTGLVNLEAVTIAANGLPNGNYIVGQCPADIAVPDINHCTANGTPSNVTVTDGTLSSTVHVYRELHNFDCASAPGACVVGFMNGLPKANFTPVAFPISFDPARPPRITVSPADGLTSGQTIEVRGVDVGAGTVRVGQCLQGSIGCVQHETIGAPDGSFSLSFPLVRDVQMYGRYPTGTGHCGIDYECEIVVSVYASDSGPWTWSNWETPVPLHFAPVPGTSTTVDVPSTTAP